MKGVKILLGVTGGIAAYKSAELCRLFVKQGATVQVVMSGAACEFITPLTMQTLSGRPVYLDVFEKGRGTVGHIDLIKEQELFVIAPATADFLARAAHGRASDCISLVTLAYKGPVLAAPAMNSNMWENPATKRNVRTLQQEHGWRFVQPASGDLACGWSGPGRMAEPHEILEAAQTLFRCDLKDRAIVVTAGPTAEDIDPVRFISNRSSGKMGFCLAAAAARRGANATLISGPTALPCPDGVEFVSVRSASEMEAAVKSRAGGSDAIIMAAAVADFRPSETSDRKLKKGADEKERTLKLVRNPDILASLGKRFGSKGRPVLVGFAVETEDLERAAKKKLKSKSANVIVANLARHGFGNDDNEAIIVDDKGLCEATGRISKTDLADRILDLVAERLL